MIKIKHLNHTQAVFKTLNYFPESAVFFFFIEVWNLALKTGWIISSGCGIGVNRLGLPTEMSWTWSLSCWLGRQGESDLGSHQSRVGSKCLGAAQRGQRLRGCCSEPCLLELTKFKAYQQWQLSEDRPWGRHLAYLHSGICGFIAGGYPSWLRCRKQKAGGPREETRASGECQSGKTPQNWCFWKISMKIGIENQLCPVHRLIF